MTTSDKLSGLLAEFSGTSFISFVNLLNLFQNFHSLYWFTWTNMVGKHDLQTQLT